MEIDIKGLDKIDVFRALYNAQPALGMGMLHYTPEPMSREDAEKAFERLTFKKLFGTDPEAEETYFDYVGGRPLKLKFEEGVDTLDVRLYDRELGNGTADFAISSLRAYGEPNNPITRMIHKEGMKAALEYTKTLMAQKPPVENPQIVEAGELGPVKVFSMEGTLGTPELRAAVDKAEKALEGR